MPPRALYVRRSADQQLLGSLLRGELCYVLSPRCIGKSSLLRRTMRELSKKQRLYVDIDLLSLGSPREPDFYAGLIDLIASQLHLKWNPALFRDRHQSGTPAYSFAAFLEQEVLPQLQAPTVIFIDEVDLVTEMPLASDAFFSTLRSVYEKVQGRPGETPRLTFCLAGIASPDDLTRNHEVSPFEVGREILLEDFTPREAEELLSGLAELDLRPTPLVWLNEILAWTDGHPSMTVALCEQLLRQDLKLRGRPDVVIRQLVHELYLACDETYLGNAEAIFNLDRERRDHAEKMSLYRRIYMSEVIEVNRRDPLQRNLIFSGLVKIRYAEKEGEKNRLVLRNRIFRERFGRRWIVSKEPPDLQWAMDKLLQFHESHKAEDALSTNEVSFLTERSQTNGQSIPPEIASYMVESQRQRRQQQWTKVAIYAAAAVLLGIIGLFIWKTREDSQKIAELEKKVRDQERLLAEANGALVALRQAQLGLIVQLNALKQQILEKDLEARDKEEQLRKADDTFEAVKSKLSAEWRNKLDAQRKEMRQQIAGLQMQLAELERDGGERLRALKEHRADLILQSAETSQQDEKHAADLEKTRKELQAAKRSAPSSAVTELLDTVRLAADSLRKTRFDSVPRSVAVRLRSALSSKLFAGAAPPNPGYVTIGGGQVVSMALCPETVARGSVSGGEPLLLTGRKTGELSLWDAAGNRLQSTTLAGVPIALSVTGRCGQRVAASDHRQIHALGHPQKGAPGDDAANPILKQQADLLAMSPSLFGELPDGFAVVGVERGKTVAYRYWLKHGGFSGAPQALSHDIPITAVAVSPDGSQIATAAEGRIYLWDSTSGKRLRQIADQRLPFSTLAFSSHDGGQTLAAASQDASIYLFSLDGKRAFLTLRTAKAPPPLAVTYSPDGRYVVSAGGDLSVRFFDAATGEIVYEMANLDSRPLEVGLSIDSGKLAVRFSNGEVRLYAVSDRDFFQMVCGLLAGRPEDERVRIREACGWR